VLEARQLQVTRADEASLTPGSTGTALYYATCATDCFTPSSWSKSVLDGSFSAVGEYPSLVVQAGVAEVSYYDRTNGNLTYLKRTP
jgi:hypothetical protein